MHIGGLGSDLARVIRFMPSSLGSRKSVSSTSKVSLSSRPMAVLASSAMYTSYRSSSAARKPSRVVFSSSTISRVGFMGKECKLLASQNGHSDKRKGAENAERRRGVAHQKMNPPGCPKLRASSAFSASLRLSAFCQSWVLASSKRGFRSWSGSQMRKVVPRPTWLSSSIRPLWARTMRCTIIKPKPEPFFLVV